MKKGLIFATTLAMALGVGVAVGAHQSKAGVKEVKADSVKLYVEIDSSMSWWQSDGAETHAHCWGGSAASTEWPGAKMTLVEGETNVYSVDIDSGYTSLIITRVNPANGDVWNRSSVDQGTPINLPADYTVANCFKLEHDGYNDGNYAGTWKLYSGSTPEPEPEKDDPSTEKNMFYVWDKDELLGDEPNNVKVYGFGQADNIKEMEWPGVHSNDYASVSTFTLGETSVYKVELSVSYPQFILNDGEHQTDDITLGSHVGEVLLPSSTESSWQSASDFTNPPASNGYYILGDNTSSWTFTGATKLGEGDEDNLAVLTNFAVTKDNQYKIKSYFDKVTAWFNYHDGEEETSFNYVAPDSNPKNIYLSKDGTFYVTDYIAPVDPDVPEHNGYYVVGSKSEWKYAGAAELTGGEDEENYAKLLNYTVAKDEAFKVKKYEDGVETWFAINGDESEAGNYVAETEKAVDIFASKDGKLYVSDHIEPDIPTKEGYYICGLDGFRYENATEMTSVVDPGEGENVAYYMNLSVKANDEIIVRSYFEDQEPKDRWSEPGDDFSKIDYGERDGNNFKFLKDGYYDIYAKYVGENFRFFVAQHVESHSVALTAVLFNGKISEGSQDLAPQIAYEGQEFEPELAREGYVLLATYTDEEMEHVYVPAEIKSDDVHLYAKYMKVGFYVIAEKDNWKLEEALPMNTAGIADTNKAEAYLNVKENELYSFVEYKADGTMAGQSGLGEGVDPLLATYDETEGGRVKFLKDASVAVYFGKDNNIYLNEGLVAFLTNFKSDVGGVCLTLDPKASEEQKAAYMTALKAAWGRQAVAFNNLTADEKAEFNKETHDESIKVLYEEMTAMYDYIIHKYGTSEFNDFIWNQNIKAVGNSMPELSTDSNVMLIVIITISAVSVASLGALLILKKKKRK